MRNKNVYEEYWDKNISKWSDLYLKISHGHEILKGNKLIAWLYNITIVPYESYLMKIRYSKTIEFIERYVKPGTIVTDIGCGTGIFTVECLLRGARVNALDISQESLVVTKKNINSKCSQFIKNVTLIKCDGQRAEIPKSDIAICVGVLPYVAEVEVFLKNLLSYTQIAFIQYSDQYRLSNIIRRMFPFLNVRRIKFQSEKQLTKISKSLGFKKYSSEKFATGRLLIFKKTNHL